MADPMPFVATANSRKRRAPRAAKDTQQIATALSISPNSFDFLFNGKPTEPLTPQRADTITPCSSPSVSKRPKSSGSTASLAASFADRGPQFKIPTSSEPAVKTLEVKARRSARQMCKAQEQEREKHIQSVGELHKDYKRRDFKPESPVTCAPNTVNLPDAFQPYPKRQRGTVEELRLCKDDGERYSADLKAAADSAMELSKAAKDAYTTQFLEGLFRWRKAAITENKEAGTPLDLIWAPNSTMRVPAERAHLFRGREDQLQTAIVPAAEITTPPATFQFHHAMDMPSFPEHISVPPTSYDDVPMIDNTNPGMPYFEQFQLPVPGAFDCKSALSDSVPPYPPLSAFTKGSDIAETEHSHLTFDCGLMDSNQAFSTHGFNRIHHSHGSSASIETSFPPGFDRADLPPLPETGPHMSELGDMGLLNEENACLQSDSRFKMDCLDLAGDIYLNFGVDESLLGLTEDDDPLLTS